MSFFAVSFFLPQLSPGSQEFLHFNLFSLFSSLLFFPSFLYFSFYLFFFVRIQGRAEYQITIIAGNSPTTFLPYNAGNPRIPTTSRCLGVSDFETAATQQEELACCQGQG
jgi:hypothetical protein